MRASRQGDSPTVWRGVMRSGDAYTRAAVPLPFTAMLLDLPSSAEENRMIVSVVIISFLIIGVGASLLVVGFRSFERAKKRGGEFRPVVLIVLMLAFVMICCLVLLAFSMLRRGSYGSVVPHARDLVLRAA